MKNMIKKLISITLVLILCLSCLPVSVSASATYDRIAGENRYETAFAAANALKTILGIDKYENIVVASGTGFADALAGSYLAAVKKAPILLVNKHFTDEVATYVDDNLASGGTVYLLGGEAAVPGQMESALIGHNVKRLAGANRYDTNLLILNEAGMGGSEILVCTGKKFADSLSASAVGKPILLVRNSLTDTQKKFLSNSSRKYIIIGGTGAVNETVEAQLTEIGTVERISGSDRYETSVYVANRFFEKPESAVLAYARNFPDGLCGGPLAYACGAPLLLTQTGRETNADAYAEDNSISGGIVLGGAGLISDETVGSIFDEKKTASECLHHDTQTKNVLAASCIAEGYTGDTVCADCGKLLTSGQTIPATDHVWGDSSCSVCGKTKEAPSVDEEKPDSECAHPDTQTKNVLAASCIAEGYTGDTVCADCGKLLTSGQTIPATGHVWVDSSCSVCGKTKEAPLFTDTDYITTSPVSIETGTLAFDIGPGVFVPGHLEETSKIVETVMEKVSGLDFDGAGYARESFPDGKVHVNVSRDTLIYGNTNEHGKAYAGSRTHAVVSPGDLYLSSSYTLVHELAHVLMFRQTEWSYGMTLNEGFAEFTTYLALKDLEQNNRDTGYYLDYSGHCIYNMVIDDYSKLYEQPLEYWFDHTFEYSGNSNYSVGFRFMWYLQDVYGDYSKWITEYEKKYNFYLTSGISDEAPVDKQIEVLKATYGEDVLDNFYPWLRSHEHLFCAADVWRDNYRDMTDISKINLYPRFGAVEPVVILERIQYDDLYINLESAVKYLSEYKNCDVSNLTLLNPDSATIILYYPDGNCTTINGHQYIPITGVSYIQLVGTGKVSKLEIAGFGAACPHQQTHLESVQEASCSAEGYTGNTVCTVCGIYVAGGEIIPKTAHNYVGGKCTTCNLTENVCVHADLHMENASYPSFTTDGYTGDCVCSICGERISTGFLIHNLVEGKCCACGIQVPPCNHSVTYMMNCRNVSCTTDGYLGDKICVKCENLAEAGYIVEKRHLWDGEKCTACGITELP